MDKTDIGNHENFSAVILFGAVYYNYTAKHTEGGSMDKILVFD